MKNDFNYKWSKLFASKRYNTKDGVIKLTPEEQQELLDDSEEFVKKSKPLTEEEVQELRNKAKKYAESGGKYLDKQETK